MDDKDYERHINKQDHKTYASPKIVRIAIEDSEGNELVPARAIRIASKVFSGAGTDSFARIKDELVIRRTTSGKQEVRAVLYEDDRGIETLTLQRYTVKTNKPHKLTHFSFQPHEIEKIIEFLATMKLLRFPSDAKINLTDDEIKELLVGKSIVSSLLSADPSAVIEFAKNEITSEDVVALAYRKKQLGEFKKLLVQEYMQECVSSSEAKGEESVWQGFFEKNQWIFGYGLNYVFSSSLDQRSLELPVIGSDITGGGKIVDALLKSKGAINSLCYVEIKKASTPLISKEYRKGCWSVDQEVAGGVAQVQNTIQMAIENLGSTFQPKNSDGYPTGEILFNYKPRGFLVVGQLDQFVLEEKIHQDKYRSFELFRRNMELPEIITFDELLERAEAIVRSDILHT